MLGRRDRSATRVRSLLFARISTTNRQDRGVGFGDFGDHLLGGMGRPLVISVRDVTARICLAVTSVTSRVADREFDDARVKMHGGYEQSSHFFNRHHQSVWPIATADHSDAFIGSRTWPTAGPAGSLDVNVRPLGDHFPSACGCCVGR